MTNYFVEVMQRTWAIMSIQFTIYGYTISYADIFVFVLLVTLLLRALFVYLLFTD